MVQSPSAVILELKEIKSVIFSIVSPSICHELKLIKGSPDSSAGKESPAMQETPVQCLGREDPLEKS